MENSQKIAELNQLIIERINLKIAYSKKLLTTTEYVETYTAISKKIKSLELIK